MPLSDTLVKLLLKNPGLLEDFKKSAKDKDPNMYADLLAYEESTKKLPLNGSRNPVKSEEPETDLKGGLSLDTSKLSKFGNYLDIAGGIIGNRSLQGIGQLATLGSSIKEVSNNWIDTSKLTGEEKTKANMMNASAATGIMGNAADIARNTFFANQAKNDSETTNTINQTYDAVSNSLMAFSPVGTAIGGFMKVGALLGDAALSLGAGTDQMTKKDQIMDSSLFSWNVGLINGIGGKRTLDFGVDLNVLSKAGSDYGGSSEFIMDSSNLANKKYGLFSSRDRRKANSQIDLARGFQNTMSSIVDDAESRRLLAGSSNSYLNYQLLLNGNDQYLSLRAKQGAKLIRIKNIINLANKKVEEVDNLIEWQPTIIFKEGGKLEEEWKPIIEFKNGGSIEEEWKPIIEFKEGGKVSDYTPLTEQKNVIPDGALHKNKHHMENSDGLTQKGIPVIDNDGEQLAEIELNEIIFSLEVTKKLEELYTKFYNNESSNKEKDEYAIEAGKLLVQEILFNTIDNTGLIDSLKNGGKING